MAKIIVECCQNHNGDRNILKDMIWSAAEAGADYVKIQSMLASELTYRERFEQGLEENGVRKVIRRPYQPEYDRLKPLDVDDATHYWFIEECQKANVKPLTTSFTRARVSFLASLSWKEIKVASYDCASVPFLKELAKSFENIFISTGATYVSEIETAARILSDTSFTFLHCVTIYPTPLDGLELSRIGFLHRYTPHVGFSDHSLVARDGLKASIAALAVGAEVIERHYSVLPPQATKDGPVSISPKQLSELATFCHASPDELKTYVKDTIPEFPAMLGKETRGLTTEELLNRDYYRGRFASKLPDGSILNNWEEGAL